MEELQTYDELNKAIMECDKEYMLLDVYGPWCKRCKDFLPTLKRIEIAYTKVSFKKLNIEKFEGFKDKYGITALPSFMIYKKENVNPLKIISGPREHEIEKELSLLTKEISIDMDF